MLLILYIILKNVLVVKKVVNVKANDEVFYKIRI